MPAVVSVGSRDLRRAVQKLLAAIESEISKLVSEGKTQEEAQRIVTLELEILRNRN